MLTLKEKIFYPFGQISISLLNQALVLGILFYYSPPRGKGEIFVPISLAGIAITIGRFLDAVIDPFIAYLSDKTNTRFGRRIPYIAFGSPILCLIFLLLWIPPSKYLPVGHFGNFLYLAFFTTLFWIFYSVVSIPYTSLLPEIATTSKERIDLSTFVAVAMVAGMIMAGFGFYILVKKSFLFMAFVFSTLALVLYILVVLTIRERAKVSSEYSQIKIIPALLTTFKNKPYLIYLYSRFSFEFGWNLIAAGLTFLVVVIMRLPEENAGIIMIVPILSALVSFPLINLVAKKFGKILIFKITMLTVGVLLSSIFFIGKINLFISLKIQSYILMILMGPPFAGFLVLPNAIIADIIDYDEKITGLRREGMYYGIQALVIKIGISLATGVAGIIMETFGKDIGRDLGVRLLGPVAAVFIFIALFVFKFYNLGEEDEAKRNL
jgi:GPH family glycoside/pentoside/hexuronide:cation symporter